MMNNEIKLKDLPDGQLFVTKEGLRGIKTNRVYLMSYDPPLDHIYCFLINEDDLHSTYLPSDTMVLPAQIVASCGSLEHVLALAVLNGDRAAVAALIDVMTETGLLEKSDLMVRSILQKIVEYLRTHYRYNGALNALCEKAIASLEGECKSR